MEWKKGCFYSSVHAVAKVVRVSAGRMSLNRLHRESLQVLQRALCKSGTGFGRFPQHFANSITKQRGGIQPRDTPSHTLCFQ